MRIVFKMADKEGAANKIFAGKKVGFCHVNAVRTSFWNETNSGMKLILVSQNRPSLLYSLWMKC